MHSRMSVALNQCCFCSARKVYNFCKHSELYTGIQASQVVLVVKNPPANAGDIRDTGLIPGLGISPVVGHGNPLQYSCLENLMDRGVFRVAVYSVTETQPKRHSMHSCALGQTEQTYDKKNEGMI